MLPNSNADTPIIRRPRRHRPDAQPQRLAAGGAR
jgi:hypothetical protein